MGRKVNPRRWQVFDVNTAGLSAVAFTGSYVDLINKPSIPVQVNADWNSTTGLSSILNKPALFSGVYSDLTGKPSLFDGTWASLTGKPTFSTVATTGAYSDLTGKPTIPSAQVNSDWNSSSGVSLILNKPTIPTVPKVAYYTVTTNASGVWTATVTGFTTVSNVMCIAANAANTAAGARIATLTSFNTTTATGTVCIANSITSILGLLGLGLSGAGVTVYVRVEGT